MHDYSDLEEYVSQMEERQQNVGADEDIYEQLARKEKDLILAAELGKALLEKNEEISRANEKLTEEYSQQLELLEQEKHALRRKLDRSSGEYEGRLSDLQADLEQARAELRERQRAQRGADRERQQIMRDLNEHNQRLAAKLKESARVEVELREQLQMLREQFDVRKSNMYDQSSQLEGLRQEISLLEGRKSDLGHRIDALKGEKENLNLSLEESGDRIIYLQHENKEKEQKIRNQQQDIEELRQTNSELYAKIELLLSSKSPVLNGHSSIQDEIDTSAPSSMEEDGIRVQMIDDGIECDDLAELFPDDEGKKELVQIFDYIKYSVAQLRKRKSEWAAFYASSLGGSSSGYDSVDSGHLSAESSSESSKEDDELSDKEKRRMLTPLVRELKSLMDDLMTQERACLSCRASNTETQNLKRVQRELQEKTAALKQKDDEINRITSQLTVLEHEAAALCEEREHLRVDVDSSRWGKDEIVRKAWTMRDQAVARKNATEIELAKTRIELMHINSQLMEAIQQKVELSTQLDQWQFDMEALLDEQMKRKLKNYEQQEEKKPKIVMNSKGKLFKLFR